uniref:CRAL-TRIO domain-containing protein n=1 Tax=Rhodosorus marinus TaxID=101924 RepID=A0A7S0BLL7_9RHOD|mmetsp:Transcript_20781/g.30178  ORF Transcript_20781/g.30178 Transcript_20781/m.30178 type:complete len:223 (+) Transcript_20781:118-786(+)
MALEIEKVFEVPVKKEERPVWVPEKVSKSHPSFLHITGASDSLGRPMVIVLGDRLPATSAFDIATLVKYIKEYLDELVKREYVLLYVHSRKAEKSGYPSLEWLRQIQDALNVNYKKNLKKIVILHPTNSLKAAMGVTFRALISPKVFRKVAYLGFVDELEQVGINPDHLELPVSVYDNDVRQMIAVGRVSTDQDSYAPPKQLYSDDPLLQGFRVLGKLTRRR